MTSRARLYNQSENRSEIKNNKDIDGFFENDDTQTNGEAGNYGKDDKSPQKERLV